MKIRLYYSPNLFNYFEYAKVTIDHKVILVKLANTDFYMKCYL